MLASKEARSCTAVVHNADVSAAYPSAAWEFRKTAVSFMNMPERFRNIVNSRRQGLAWTRANADDVGAEIGEMKDNQEIRTVLRHHGQVMRADVETPSVCQIAPLWTFSAHSVESVRQSLEVPSPQWYGFNVVCKAKCLGSWLGPAAVNDDQCRTPALFVLNAPRDRHLCAANFLAPLFCEALRQLRLLRFRPEHFGPAIPQLCVHRRTSQT